MEEEAMVNQDIEVSPCTEVRIKRECRYTKPVDGISTIEGWDWVVLDQFGHDAQGNPEWFEVARAPTHYRACLEAAQHITTNEKGLSLDDSNST